MCRFTPGWVCACLITLTLPLPAAEPATVRVERVQRTLHVVAEVPVTAAPATAWDVLTDYDHLSGFVPGLVHSRLVSGPGEPLRLEQRGEAGLLLLRFSVHVVLELEETREERIAFRAVGGNVRRMQGDWRVLGRDGGLLLRYEAEVEPDFWVPPFIGSSVMRSHLARQMDAVAREVERRQAIRGGIGGAVPDP